MKRLITECDQCTKEINGQGVIRVEGVAVRQDITEVEVDDLRTLAHGPAVFRRGEVCSPGCLATWFQHQIIKTLETRPA